MPIVKPKINRAEIVKHYLRKHGFNAELIEGVRLEQHRNIEYVTVESDGPVIDLSAMAKIFDGANFIHDCREKLLDGEKADYYYRLGARSHDSKHKPYTFKFILTPIHVGSKHMILKTEVPLGHYKNCSAYLYVPKSADHAMNLAISESSVSGYTLRETFPFCAGGCVVRDTQGSAIVELIQGGFSSAYEQRAKKGILPISGELKKQHGIWRQKLIKSLISYYTSKGKEIIFNTGESYKKKIDLEKVKSADNLFNAEQYDREIQTVAKELNLNYRLQGEKIIIYKSRRYLERIRLRLKSFFKR